jgi:hypothetical protein
MTIDHSHSFPARNDGFATGILARLVRARVGQASVDSHRRVAFGPHADYRLSPTFLAKLLVAGPTGVTAPAVLRIAVPSSEIAVVAAAVVADVWSSFAGMGFVPAPRTDTSLPRRSNQNGALLTALRALRHDTFAKA